MVMLPCFVHKYVFFSLWVCRYSAEEIEEKVNSFRMMLQEKQEPAPTSAEKAT